jgi:hypothetical protein
MLRHLLLAAALLLGAAPAYADVIITFGQSGGGNTITGVAGPTGTFWGGNDIPITITQIAPNGPVTPIAAFLDVSASSISGAQTLGTLVAQHFTGGFTINANAAGTGTNYLAGSFSDGALTRNGATGIAVFAADGLFNSDVILALSDPLSINFALTNVTPPVSLLACTNTNPGCDTGQTINSFTAAIAGDASATIPEPASLALFGASLLGLGVLRRRKDVRLAA